MQSHHHDPVSILMLKTIAIMEKESKATQISICFCIKEENIITKHWINK